MALRIPDRWIWDFWLARNGNDYHAFYLQAPRALGDPDLRHSHASIGHAVSTDLRAWHVLPDAVLPGEAGTWDDAATWTGSVIERDGRWYLFYTGTSLDEHGLVQRVGLATSDDLITWTKQGAGPVIEADDRWYEVQGSSAWPDEAWRDPWVMQIDGTFHALITARSCRGPVDERGVIGHAVSTDLLTWEVRPPLSQPGEFAQLEVPQIANVNGDCLLVFSCDAPRVAARRRRRIGYSPRDAVYAVSAPGPLGPFEIQPATECLPEGLYAGRLVRDPDGTPVWLAFVDRGPDGTFSGELSDPIRYPWTGA